MALLALAAALLAPAPLAAAASPTVSIATISKQAGSLSTQWHRVHPSAALATESRLRATPGVMAVGIPGMRHALGDPRRNEQWALDRLDQGKVRELAEGSGIVVAVVDSGVDGNHPDLKGQVMPGLDLVSGGDGWNDQAGHGTHVAGIIAAAAGNDVGVEGLAPAVRILPVRVLDATGYGPDDVVAQGVLWAVENGAQVINLSLGGPDRDPLLADAVTQATRRGVAVVVAAGNDGMSGNTTSYPAANPDAVAVAATAAGDTRALFSTAADYVDIAAPGNAILSTVPGGGYAYLSGTSMATPYASAAVALVAARLAIPATQAAARVVDSATDLGEAGRDNSFGAGLIDPYAALTDGKPRPAPPPGTLPIPGMPSMPMPSMPSLPSMPKPSMPSLPSLPSMPSVPSTPSLPALPGTPGTPTSPPAGPSPAPSPPALPSSPGLNDSRKTSSLTVQRGNDGRVSIRLRSGTTPLAGKPVTVMAGSARRTVTTSSNGTASTRMPRRGTGVMAVFPGDQGYAPGLSVTLD